MIANWLIKILAIPAAIACFMLAGISFQVRMYESLFACLVMGCVFLFVFHIYTKEKP